MKKKGKSAKKTIVMTIIFMLAVFFCNSVNAARDSMNVKVIANTVCKEVGVVDRVVDKGATGVEAVEVVAEEAEGVDSAEHDVEECKYHRCNGFFKVVVKK